MTASLPGGARVAFTDRSDGNMSSVGGLDAHTGAANRARLRNRLGVRMLARGYQVHGATVQTVREMPDGEPDAGALDRADGQVTSLPGLGAAVLVADCLPVAIARVGAVAMIHAGWRGLGAGVLERGVGALAELGGGGELHAVLGPCAGPCCYEVGPEVHAALRTGVARKAKVDLRAIAEERVRAAGVASVVLAGGCTICDERFFSYRREGAAAGRQAGVAWLS
jgi:hypothetical protein